MSCAFSAIIVSVFFINMNGKKSQKNHRSAESPRSDPSEEPNRGQGTADGILIGIDYQSCTNNVKKIEHNAENAFFDEKPKKGCSFFAFLWYNIYGILS